MMGMEWQSRESASFLLKAEEIENTKRTRKGCKHTGAEPLNEEDLKMLMELWFR
jgi:hypothetical protein